MVNTVERPPAPRSTTSTIPLGWAAGIGLVSVGAALGVGDLVAGVVSPPSSPVLAVGAQFIRMTPEWLKEFATSTFGTWDKTVLLGGMALTLLLVALAAGVASRRRVGPGLTVVGLLGLAGLAATTQAPTFAPADLLAPLAALGVGGAILQALHGRALSWAAEHGTAAGQSGPADAGSIGTRSRAGGTSTPGTSTPGTSTPGTSTPDGSTRDGSTRDGSTPDSSNPDGRLTHDGPTAARRRLVLGVGASAALAVVAGGLGRWLAGNSGAEASRSAVGALPPAAPAGPSAAPNLAGADFAAVGTPRWLTANKDFYRIDTALQVPQISTADYALRIHGMVDREIRLSYDQLRGRRLVEAPITMCCVSNDIGGNLISNAVFTGVPLRDLLREAGVRPGAQQIFSTSSDGWTSGTPVAALTDGRAAMLALGMNGEPLPIEHGFPVRMVVPGLYGFVSGCKWITDMEVTTWADQTPYWEQRGWGQQAPIKTQSRIDVPRTEASVPAGRVVVAGTTWAQHTGVDRVEVRADDGPWQPTDLSREINADTWRMWRTTLDLPRGRHQLQVRATDRTGYTQTPRFTLTIPDGATGWHTINVNCT